ncbi:fimbrial protein LpfD; adhesin [Escherichia coli]|nr:fimbrial protein LpfD; adhesin [Escherichia coli]SQM27289.1 fimbrial protein LpfD; adhesin [Escherichia coli]
MMNPVPWLQMTNMISYQGLVRTFPSGAKAIVYFYIKKTFAGKLIIPETKIVTLYGTISRDTPVDYSQPMADVYIRGDITAPQSCEINNLQPVYFDFKEIPAADFSSVVGSAVTTHKITKTVTIECENLGILNTDDISTSFYATEPNTDNSMVVTSNSNVGIKIYDKNNKEIKVNGGELPTDMGKSTVYGEKSGSVTFWICPYISRHLLSLNPLQARCRRYSRGER